MLEFLFQDTSHTRGIDGAALIRNSRKSARQATYPVLKEAAIAFRL
jgi:hypothetical protein